MEHIIPLSRGAPDEPSNAVLVCKSCNSSKGGRRLYGWFRLENRNRIPRIAEGKCLKLLYDLHSGMDTPARRPPELCPSCDLETPWKGEIDRLHLARLVPEDAPRLS